MLFRPIFPLFYVFGVYARPETYSSLDKRTFDGFPERNITCLGSSYEVQLPLRSDGTNPNELTMQQLCAKSVYGGAPEGWNLGGWCSKGLRYSVKRLFGEPVYDENQNLDYEDSTYPQGVSFDLSLPGGFPEVFDPRFLLGCFNRCFCNYGVDDLTIQPRRDDPSIADAYLEHSDASGEIMLDVTDDLDTMEHEHTGRLGEVEVETVGLREMNEPTTIDGIAVLSDDNDPPWRLNMDAGNYITCEGDLPWFPLPDPYPTDSFQNPQELCAVQFSGGLS